MNTEHYDWKYQYSQSDGNGGILVARTDDKAEVQALKDLVDGIVGKKQSQTQKPVSNHFCDKHQKEMKERSFKGSVWYDHRRKLPDETWEQCKGFGYPSETRQKIDDTFGDSEATASLAEKDRVDF